MQTAESTTDVNTQGSAARTSTSTVSSDKRDASLDASSARDQLANCDQRHFFIVGCPRSGTTLLQAMLNRHPQVAIPPELKLFAHYHKQPSWIRRRAVRRIEEDLGISLRSQYSAKATTTNQLFAEVGRRYVEGIGRHQVKAIGEKSPENTASIDEIAQAFPGSPVIALVRDGRAAAESLSRMPWLRCDLRSGALIWRYYARHITRAIDAGIPNVHVLHYEELIADPRRELEQVLDLIGVALSELDVCLSPAPDRDRELFPAREASWKSQAVEPLASTSSDNARRLTDHEIAVVESICGEEFHRFGYLNSCPTRSSRIGDTVRNSVAYLRIARSLPAWMLVAESVRRWKKMVAVNELQ